MISRPVFAALAVLLFCGPAGAVSILNEATQNCRFNGDPDVKIARCSEIIPNPYFISLQRAYLERSFGFYRKGDLAHAFADCDNAAHAPVDTPQAGEICRAYYGLAANDLQRAVSGFSMLAAGIPRYFLYHLMLGISEFYAGRADQALDDVRRAADLDHQNLYAMLWVHIIEGRIGGTSTLGERSKYLRLNRWPAPIVRMILGEISRDDALNQAMQSYSTTRALKLCEIDFYGGQNALIMGHRDEAKRLLGSAAATCVPEMDFTNWWPGFIEREAAGRDRGTLDRR